MEPAKDASSTPDALPGSDVTSTTPNPGVKRSRTGTNASNSSVAGRIRSASIKAMEATPPPGMWAATGTVTSKAPSLSDIRSSSFTDSGWNREPQRAKAERRNSQTGRGLQRTASNLQNISDVNEETSSDQPGVTRVRSTEKSTQAPVEPFPTLTEEDTHLEMGRSEKDARHALTKAPSGEEPANDEPKGSSKFGEKGSADIKERTAEVPSQYANGYVPPPKLPWTTSTAIGLKAFWKWMLTPMGFLITIYGANVIAWGGMLFLLLCNASPAMCKPSCDHIESPRRKWIEIDSQVVNALFCVTGFGLAPWRFRDLYWLAVWRWGVASRKCATRRLVGMRRLAGIHRGWFRLPGSQNLSEYADKTGVDPNDPAVPVPVTSIPDPPPTGMRAPPTKLWKMDFVVWMNVMNTVIQVILCFYMWHYNRYDRPSWATGTFVAMGCIAAGVAGIMMFIEGKAVKKVEGVPMPEGGYPDVQRSGSEA